MPATVCKVCHRYVLDSTATCVNSYACISVGVHVINVRFGCLQAQAARSEAAVEQQRAALIAAAVHKLAAKATATAAPAVTSRDTSAQSLQQRTSSTAARSSSVDQLADQHSSSTSNSTVARNGVARSGVSRGGRRASTAGSMWSVTDTATDTAASAGTSSIVR
jgi:hypothetical protein